jgi:MFS family permease
LGTTAIKGISRNTLLLGVVSFFQDVASEMVAPLLPVFLSTVLHASMPFIGLIEGVAQSVSSVLKPVSGWVSDRIGRRRPGILLGYWLAACTRPLMAVAGSPWHVLGLRFADRFGKGVRTAPRDALIADSTEPGYRGKAFGLHRALDNMGAAVGMLGASLILLGFTTDLRTVFWLAGVVGLAAPCIVVFGVRERRRAAEPQPAEAGDVPGGAAPRTALSPNLVKWYVVVFVFWLGNSADAFLILKATAEPISIPLWQIPLLMCVMNVVRALCATHAGALSDRLGRKEVILFGWVFYALVYVGFAFAGSRQAMYVLFAAYGLYYAITEGAERALVTDMSPQKNRATALGLYHFTAGIAALPASVICGLLWQWNLLGANGPRVALAFGAACALLAALMFAVLLPGRRQPPEED